MSVLLDAPEWKVVDWTGLLELFLEVVQLFDYSPLYLWISYLFAMMLALPLQQTRNERQSDHAVCLPCGEIK